MSIEQIIKALDVEISRLQQAKSLLNYGGAATASGGVKKGLRIMTAATRAKIAAAQRRRWARVKAQKKK